MKINFANTLHRTKELTELSIDLFNHYFQEVQPLFFDLKVDIST